MIKFRKDLKDPYIMECGINPIDYDSKRGVEVKLSSPADYKPDKADGIIIKAAMKYLKKKKQLKNTFNLLYACYQIESVQTWLSDSSHQDIKTLKMSTVMYYLQKARREILKMIENDETLKLQILETIKSEYAKHT